MKILLISIASLLLFDLAIAQDHPAAYRPIERHDSHGRFWDWGPAAPWRSERAPTPEEVERYERRERARLERERIERARRREEARKREFEEIKEKYTLVWLHGFSDNKTYWKRYAYDAEIGLGDTVLEYNSNESIPTIAEKVYGD